MTPTPEQQAIIEAAIGTRDSLLLSALAGSAKTTTLKLTAKALPSTLPILALSFTKAAANSLGEAMPTNAKCSTVNSVCHRVWATATGKRLIVDTDKTYKLLKATVEALPRREQGDAYESFTETKAIIRAAKVAGWVPSGTFDNARRLVSDDDFFDGLEEPPTEQQIALARAVIVAGIREAYAGRIDFDDQIYMPALFGGSFPRFPLVMVDEAQDLSPLNHAILDKLVVERLIAVGDENQSIYAFRGADTNSMSRLRARFAMRELPLSVSFRCPRAVVRLAQSRAPHMQWPEWAIEGHTETLGEWNADSIPDGAAVLCRNNAPLFKLAMALLRAGRGVNLVGTDLGPSLLRTLRRLGDDGMKQSAVLVAIDKWEGERLGKSKNKAAVIDKADCLRVFAGFGETLSQAVAYADHLFRSKGPVQLLSGHKAKGLEWETVYHLDPWRIPSKWAETPEERTQERNLEYVITTRAKQNLFFVTMEGFHVQN